MADDSALPLRMLRLGLKAASRAGASVVERVLRSDANPGPPRLRPAEVARRAQEQLPPQ